MSYSTASWVAVLSLCMWRVFSPTWLFRAPIVSCHVQRLFISFATKAVALARGKKDGRLNHVNGLVQSSRQAVIQALRRDILFLWVWIDMVVILPLVLWIFSHSIRLVHAYRLGLSTSWPVMRHEMSSTSMTIWVTHYLVAAQVFSFPTFMGTNLKTLQFYSWRSFTTVTLHWQTQDATLRDDLTAMAGRAIVSSRAIAVACVGLVITSVITLALRRFQSSH